MGEKKPSRLFFNGDCCFQGRLSWNEIVTVMWHHCSLYGILLLFVTSPLSQTLSFYSTCSKLVGFRRLTTETLLAAHEGSVHKTKLVLSSGVYWGHICSLHDFTTTVNRNIRHGITAVYFSCAAWSAIIRTSIRSWKSRYTQGRERSILKGVI